MIAIFGVLVGVALGLLLNLGAPAWLEPYLPIMVIAAIDALVGGLRARLERVFDDKVFVVSFISNTIIAALIVFLGDQLGVGTQLSMGVVIVLGMRIFANASSIRRLIFGA